LLDIREWAILAIRNLCQDNAENQRIIEGLKLQAVQQDVHLSQANIRAEINSHGKLSFRHGSMDEE
jgi:hypothetical protein